MPVIKCGKNRWKIGKGKCMYKSKAAAVRAYIAYLAKNPDADALEVLQGGIPDEEEQEG